MNRLTQEQVFEAIKAEREHQKRKYGADKQQSIPGFLLVLEQELQEAKDGWIKNVSGRDSVLSEVVQVAAVAFACLEKYGITGSAFATDDIIDPLMQIDDNSSDHVLITVTPNNTPCSSLTFRAICTGQPGLLHLYVSGNDANLIKAVFVNLVDVTDGIRVAFCDKAYNNCKLSDTYRQYNDDIEITFTY